MQTIERTSTTMKTKRTTPSKVKVITPDSIKKELLALLKEQNVRFIHV